MAKHFEGAYVADDGARLSVKLIASSFEVLFAESPDFDQELNGVVGDLPCPFSVKTDDEGPDLLRDLFAQLFPFLVFQIANSFNCILECRRRVRNLIAVIA